MTTSISQANCGNPPKMQFIEAFHHATAQGEIETLLTMVTDDVEFDLIASQTIKGKEDLERYLQTEVANRSIKRYTLASVLSHGRHGAASGEVETESGERFAFADFVEFSSASGKQIKSIQRYIISL